MNILFVTDTEINPIQGGTERITYTLSREFIQRGIPCHLAYYKPCDEPADFDGKLVLDKGNEAETLRKYITDNGIDSVIVNLVSIECKRSFYPAMTKARKGTDCKVYACFHAMAGEELLGNNIDNAFWRIRHGKQSFSDGLKDIALKVCPQSLVKCLYRNYIRSRYRLLYDNCDRLVMLSERDFANFAKLAGIKPDEKFIAIGNALSFKGFLKPEELDGKSPEVMMLSRMDERSKRISAALKIWQKAAIPGWTLVIVGGGPDLDYFKKLARRMGLANVSFEGRQPDAIPYYRRAAVYMLTSSYEGWGITLTEAQQMGAVPIAFDSYPALRDVLTDGEDGVIVRNNDTDGFVAKLRDLIQDRDKREGLALNGLNNCRRHSVENVVNQWIKLLEKR